MTSFAGFRYESLDYFNYVEIFKEINDINFFNLINVSDNTPLYYIEPGFRFLVKIISIIYSNPIFIFFIVALLSVSLNLITYKKYSPFVFISILWYFTHTFLLRELIQIRAGLACAICIYSIKYIISKEKIKFILLIIGAATFHLASMIFIFTYFFCNNKFITKKILSFFLFFSLLIGMFFPMGQFLGLIGIEKIMLYLNSALYNAPIGIFSNPTVIKSLFISIVCLLFYDKLSIKLPYFEIFFKIFILSTIWLLIFNDFSILAGRVATFLSVTEVLLVPSFLLLFKRNLFNQSLVWSIVVIVAGLILFLNYYSENILDYHLSIYI